MLLGCALVAAVAAVAQPIENNVDRPGLDYANVTLPPGSAPQACQALCSADAGTCRAWTFVRESIQAANPRCWLKNAVPPAVANNCCVSGVWAAVLEPNLDRPGGDFANVTLPPGSMPQACRALCDADGACQAWTYVTANVQAPNPRCWLKNVVPEAVASNCCTSGVKNP
jgi:hypothetical protein